MSSDSPHVPRKIDLKKDQRLRIEWANGGESIYPLTWLRQMCPCAACRTLRNGTDPHQLLQPAPQAPGDASAHEPGEGARSLTLRVLPKHFTSDAEPVTVTSAQLVGNYAIQINFSDGHTSGIYSFAYLREIARG